MFGRKDTASDTASYCLSYQTVFKPYYSGISNYVTYTHYIEEHRKGVCEVAYRDSEETTCRTCMV